MKGGKTPMNTQQKNNGFTIIEVVLVLAIAGLIFLMVFVALPALQAGQRDTARKSDASTVLSAVNTYISGNRGNLPDTNLKLTGGNTAVTGHTGFVKPGGFVQDVSSNTEAIKVQTYSATVKTAPVKDGEIVITLKAKCGSTGVATAGTATQQLVAGTTNQYTVTTFLEGGGGVSYCAQS